VTQDTESVRPDPPVDARLNKLVDAITSVCGWLPLSVRYRAAGHALDVVKAWQEEGA
jgi:hypothetical protein